MAVAIVGGLLPSAAADTAADRVRLHVQYAKAAGTTFAYAELGSGTPLLMLNGTGSPMNEWDPALLAGLQKSHHVIVVDYPGLGLSGPAPSQWNFPRAADWMAEFAETVVPGEKIDVLGWSMGGFVAHQLAIRH
ncbi:MAG: alpha/beta fold hydrolase, partial [Actinomycetota bacterium]|nr:alpha/beta fold hydrolase [Actinomycetota bacterium]